jgi:RNA polymerase sigma-70 factor, ECF subfamily
LRAEIPLNPGISPQTYWRHDEASLIRLAQGGDEGACAALYDRHYDAVYRYCFYRLADAEAAQDLTAEVFVRMVQRLPAFRLKRQPLLAWLYTIARDLVNDQDRGKSNDGPSASEGQRAADSSVDPARKADQRLAAERLAAAMAHLKEEERQTVLLRFMEALDKDQVAYFLGKTEGAVESLQYRALGALRRTLQKENGL